MLNKQGEGKINWTQFSWNPISGCLYGCPYCYLDRISKFDKKPAFHPERLKDLETLNQPSLIFVGSSGEMFGNWVDAGHIQQVIDVMERYPQHTFQLLTKNPIRYAEFHFRKDNVWLGTTVDGTERTKDNLEILKAKKDNHLFVSFEPLLQEVNPNLEGISWVIIGGKSGSPKFHPPKIWIENIIREAFKREIPVFVKDNAGFEPIVRGFPEGMFYEP